MKNGIEYGATSYENLIKVYTLTPNTEYVDAGNFQGSAVVIGKTAIVTLNNVAFKKSTAANGTLLFTGAPRTGGNWVFGLPAEKGNQKPMRLRIETDGKIYTHWSDTPATGDVSNIQYSVTTTYQIP